MDWCRLHHLTNIWRGVSATIGTRFGAPETECITDGKSPLESSANGTQSLTVVLAIQSQLIDRRNAPQSHNLSGGCQRGGATLGSDSSTNIYSTPACPLSALYGIFHRSRVSVAQAGRSSSREGDRYYRHGSSSPHWISYCSSFSIKGEVGCSSCSIPCTLTCMLSERSWDFYEPPNCNEATPIRDYFAPSLKAVVRWKCRWLFCKAAGGPCTTSMCPSYSLLFLCQSLPAE